MKNISRNAAFYIRRISGYFIFPVIILILLREPNFMNGFIAPVEIGQYLPCIDSIFGGKVPYKDFFYLFGPLQLYMMVFAMAVLGKTIAVFKTFFYINYIASFIVIYLLARNIYRNKTLVYLMALICIVEVSHPFWATFFDYGRMGLGIAVLILLIRFAKTAGRGYLYAAGCLSSFTLLYTTDIGIFSIIASVFFILIYSVTEGQVGIRFVAGRFFRNLSHYVLGVFLIIVPFFLFLLVKGALIPYIQTAFYVMPKYWMKVWGQPALRIPWQSVTSVSDFFTLTQDALFKKFLPLLIYAFIFFYLIFCLVRKRWDKDKTVMSLLFIYGVLVYKASFRATYGPQLLVSLPPLIMLVGIFVEKMLAMRTVLSAGIILMLAMFFLTSHQVYYGSFLGWMKYQKSKPYLSPVTSRGPAPLDRLDLVKPQMKIFGNVMIPREQLTTFETVADYLKKHTEPGEEVFTYPEQGLYNFLAERPAFGKYYIAGFAFTTQNMRKELMNELITKRPKTIVYGKGRSILAISIGRTDEILPEVRDFIDNNYHSVFEADNIVIYNINPRLLSEEKGLRGPDPI